MDRSRYANATLGYFHQQDEQGFMWIICIYLHVLGPAMHLSGSQA